MKLETYNSHAIVRKGRLDLCLHVIVAMLFMLLPCRAGSIACLGHVVCDCQMSHNQNSGK